MTLYLLAATVAALVSFAIVTAAHAHNAKLEAQARKSDNVLRFFRTHAWLVAPNRDKCHEVPWQRSCRIGRAVVRRHEFRLPRLQARLELLSVPRGEAALRAYIDDDCLEEIVDRETAGTWSPTVYNYQGSGAYGLPQALPGHKMASAGADWRTNPQTQIEWMVKYTNARYGSTCGALAFHNRNGWY